MQFSNDSLFAELGGDLLDWRYCDKSHFPSNALSKESSLLCDLTENEDETGKVRDEWTTDDTMDWL